MERVVLSTWAQEVITRYESGVAGCFLLHGNVGDRVVLPQASSSGMGSKLSGETRLGGLKDYLEEVMLPRFEVVVSYGLGQGIKVERGGKLFTDWSDSKVGKGGVFPAKPIEAVRFIGEYLLYLRNAKRIAQASPESDMMVPKVAVILRDVELMVPAIPNALNYDLNALASVLRSWSSETALQEFGQVVFLISGQKNAVHSLVSDGPGISAVEIGLPDSGEIKQGLTLLAKASGSALAGFEDFDLPAQRLTGATMGAVERLVKLYAYKGKSIEGRDLNELKKRLVEEDCEGLIGFVEPDRSLTDVIGLDGVKKWLKEDMDLWEQGEEDAMPMGYLFCGPVGTGKTYLAECLAGEAGVPVVTIKNFRDRWVGSTEANLEKIFTLLHALGRCIVFVDEADQALGSRQSNSGDSGVGNRVYSMMAKEMSNTRNRGKLLWVLASSRPDLLEVDLKRPGRVDVKLPLFPSTEPEEAFVLLRALCGKNGVEIPEEAKDDLLGLMPELLTPGAAEALAVKSYRVMRTSGRGNESEKLNGVQALQQCLENYRAPIPADVLRLQMRLAAEEATDESFVPKKVREILDLKF